MLSEQMGVLLLLVLGNAGLILLVHDISVGLMSRRWELALLESEHK